MKNMIQQQRTGNSMMEEMPGARVAFKYHLISYMLMNVFFWLGWLSYGRSIDDQINWLPWPLYPMLFGAVALLFHFLATYVLPVKTNEANEY